MTLKEFAKMLDGREYGYPQFSDEELMIAKEEGFVIVSGASDDLVELDGAITDEGDCFDGGKFFVKATSDGGIVAGNCERSNVFSFDAKWCEDTDEKGNIISWTYDVSIEHEDFMICEDGEPYCRGFVFQIVDCKNEHCEKQEDEFWEDIMNHLLGEVLYHGQLPDEETWCKEYETEVANMIKDIKNFHNDNVKIGLEVSNEAMASFLVHTEANHIGNTRLIKKNEVNESDLITIAVRINDELN